MKTFNQFITEANEEMIIVDKDGTVINNFDFKKGDKVWLKDGNFHRENGPAIEFNNGIKFWYQNGKMYRLNGPAVEYANGSKFWYINNKSPEKWTEQELKLIFANNDLQDLMKYPEIKEKLQEFKFIKS